MMMNTMLPIIVLYQVNIGNYDPAIVHVAQSYPYNRVYYSADSENLYTDAPSPYAQSKRYRLLPNRCSRVMSHQPNIVVYMDANVRIIHPAFIEHIARMDWTSTDIALFAHEKRDCAYDEMARSKRMAKYRSVNFTHYQDDYLAEGFPRHYGLFWNGVMAFNMATINTTRLTRLMQCWWSEMNKYAPAGYMQDQVHFPVCVWRDEPRVRITTLPRPSVSAMVQRQKHNSDSGTSNVVLWLELGVFWMLITTALFGHIIIRKYIS